MHSGEDPEDRSQIEQAKQTYGDFKMKTSASYIVPENQRVNFAKKRQQMVLLEGSIHKLKVDFNKKIQELKLRKREIIDRVKNLNGRLGEINGDLNENVDLFVPTIDEAVEYPEKFFEIKEHDIENYRKQKVEDLKKAAAAKKSNHGGPKAKAVEEVQATTGPAGLTAAQDAAKTLEAKAIEAKAVEERKRNPGLERKGKKVQEGELDTEMVQIRKIELGYERDQL